jgi:hypothetical protein
MSAEAGYIVEQEKTERARQSAVAADDEKRLIAQAFQEQTKMVQGIRGK